MKYGTWIYALVLAVPPQPAKKTEQHALGRPKTAAVELRLSGLKDCDGCKMEVRDALSKVSGVSKVEMANDRTRCTVRYNTDKTKVSDLIAAVRSAGDFDARDVKTPWPATGKPQTRK